MVDENLQALNLQTYRQYRQADSDSLMQDRQIVQDYVQ